MHRQDLGDTTIGSSEECIGATTASSLSAISTGLLVLPKHPLRALVTSEPSYPKPSVITHSNSQIRLAYVILVKTQDCSLSLLPPSIPTPLFSLWSTI